MTEPDTLEIVDVSSSGEGVGRRYDGMVVFVPGALPGDRIVAGSPHRVSGRWIAPLERLVSPSPDRIDPPCPVQSECGGCPLMPLRPERALELKARRLGEAIARIGKITPPEVETVGSPHPLRYRQRARFRVAMVGGISTIGFHPPGRDDEIVPVSDCLLVPARGPELAHAFLEAFDRLGGEGGTAPRPEELEVRHSVTDDRWTLTVHTLAGPWPTGEEAARQVVSAHDDLKGIARIEHGAGGRERRVTPLAGDATLTHDVAGARIEVPGSGFLQVNVPVAESLREHVAAQLPVAEDERVLDLYCGAGGMGLRVASADQPLVGIERTPGAVRAARAAAERLERTRARFECGDAERELFRHASRGERYDVAILNPPRAGIAKGIPKHLEKLAVSRGAIVSCDAGTLARDLGRLDRLGYRVVSLTAFDMFPQTAHLEAVACFERSGE